jgi:hypothetical protein
MQTGQLMGLPTTGGRAQTALYQPFKVAALQCVWFPVCVVPTQSRCLDTVAWTGRRRCSAAPTSMRLEADDMLLGLGPSLDSKGIVG